MLTEARMEKSPPSLTSTFTLSIPSATHRLTGAGMKSSAVGPSLPFFQSPHAPHILALCWNVILIFASKSLLPTYQSTLLLLTGLLEPSWRNQLHVSIHPLTQVQMRKKKSSIPEDTNPSAMDQY